MKRSSTRIPARGGGVLTFLLSGTSGTFLPSHPSVLAAGLILLSLLSAPAVVAQGRDISILEPSDAAQVRFSVATTIRDDGPGAGPLGRIAVNSDSSLVAVAEGFNRTQVSVYSSSGAFVRTIGRTGDGPGEFRNVMTLATLSDSLFVYDNIHFRESVFDFAGQVHRSRSVLPRTFRAVPFGDGRLVVNAQDTSPDRVGAYHHVIDSAGTTILSFPGAGGRFRADEAALNRRSLARASSSTFWSAPPNQYVIEHWGLNGELLARLVREVDWFEPHRQTNVFRPDVPPEPRIWDLFYDANGHLWVLIHVRDTRWRAQFRSDRSEDMAFNGDLHSYWDSVVEVIEPISGRLLASVRHDLYFAGFTSAGHLMSYHEPAQQSPFINIWNLTF